MTHRDAATMAASRSSDEWCSSWKGGGTAVWRDDWSSVVISSISRIEDEAIEEASREPSLQRAYNHARHAVRGNLEAAAANDWQPLL